MKADEPQVKLQNGEYLALDRVESIYKFCGTLTIILSPFQPDVASDVVQFLCVCVPSYADRPMAVVYPVRLY
jgi:long-chain acyl-CoA synthetase